MSEQSKSLIDRIKKTGGKTMATLKESDLFDVDFTPTDIPVINLALSCSFDGGIMQGHTMIAGPSKHFKSMFALTMAASYLKAHSDAVLLFYISEFGTPKKYFETLGIPEDRTLVDAVEDVEELTHKITNQLQDFTRKDKVIIVIDSIGNLASRKESEDALKGDNKVDMTRAKAMKALFRIITPKLTTKAIPLITVNHTYKTMEMFSKDVVSGGTGAYYSADNVWIVGRRQYKDKSTDKEISGWDFIINVDKSRYVREKSKIPITVKFDGGLNKRSGLFDLALGTGFIEKPKQGKYVFVDRETGELLSEEMSEEEAKTSPVLDIVLANKEFRRLVEDFYSLGRGEKIEIEDLPDDEDEI